VNWADILGNVASGGVLGLLGTVTTFVMGYFQRRQEHAQTLERERLVMERLRVQGEVDAARTAGEVAVARESGAAAAFTESVRAERSLRADSRWVCDLRASVRPALTFVLILLTAIIWFSTDDVELRQYVATNVVVTAVAAVTWWFGQRQLDRSQVSWGAGGIQAQVGSQPSNRS
jgi:hypothetical protein